jgi:hypothetical protein
MKAATCGGVSVAVLAAWVIFDPAAGAGGLAIASLLIAAERRYRRRATDDAGTSASLMSAPRPALA